MSDEHTTPMTVMFADVAGSVQLYDQLGDIEAHNIVLNCLNTMSDIIGRFQGRVIETIGDEIMCAFPNADYAMAAACMVQESLHVKNTPVNVRIGFHAGPTAVENGHPFGDTVNVAARVVALAKAGQILMSHQTYAQLSAANQNRTRHFHRLLLKGKQEPTDIYEIIWDEVDSTKSYSDSALPPAKRVAVSSVRIQYGHQELLLNQTNHTITMGRSDQCHLVIESQLASRLHATITWQPGNVLFTDQSTNGTFIRTREGKRAQDALDLFLHRENWVMQSGGIISLGEPINNNSSHLISFECL